MSRGRNSTVISVRLPDRLLKEARDFVKEEGLSLNEFIHRCISHGVSHAVNEKHVSQDIMKHIPTYRGRAYLLRRNKEGDKGVSREAGQKTGKQEWKAGRRRAEEEWKAGRRRAEDEHAHLRGVSGGGSGGVTPALPVVQPPAP